MKNTIPAKFSLTAKAIRIDSETASQFRLCLRRKGKTINSKVYRRTGQYTQLNETMEFPTTLEQSQRGYESKKVTLQLQIKENNEAVMQSMSMELQLTFFLDSKQFDILLCNDKMTAEAKIQGFLQTEGCNPSSSVIEAHRSSDLILERDNPAHKFDSKSAFGPAKKQKTWLKKNQQDTRSLDGSVAPVQKGTKAKSQYAIEQPIEVKASNQADKYSVDINNDDKQKKRVLFHEPSKKDQSDNQSYHAGDYRSTKSEAADFTEKQLGELRISNRLLKKENDQLKIKLEQYEIKENNSTSMEQSVITRLKQEVLNKNKSISVLELKISETEIQKRNLQDEISKLQKQLKDMMSMKDRSQLSQSTCSSNLDLLTPKKMQKEYEAEIAQLKKKLTETKRQLLFKDLQNASVPANMINTEICLSKQCDNQKKELKNTIKTLKKSLQEIEGKLKTKQKLLDTYNQVRADRQRDHYQNKQNDKWKAEKSLLEQQISALKEQLKQSPGNSNLSKDAKPARGTQYVRRSEKQAIQKELEKIKKSFYQIGQEHETQGKQLKQQLLKCKHLIMNLLNAVQEYGGRMLFDKVSDVSFII